MSASLQVLMPMGGLGSRFSKAGFATPKPLIEVDGKPMFLRALESFKNAPNVNYIFIIRKEHDEAFSLRAAINRFIPDAKIVLLDHDTAGAVETCMLAEDFINDTSPITIADCDTYFESKLYFDKVASAIQTGKPDGMLLTFSAQDPRYSYVALDNSGKVLRTAEKVVISDNAILGGYFFRSGSLFKNLARQFLHAELPSGLTEYYMSHLFNLLLEQGGSIEIAPVDKKYIFGTPEELQSYIDGEQ